jgi:hypothetical protein
MKHIAIAKTDNSKAAFASGVGVALREGLRLKCPEVLLVVPQNSQLDPGGIELVLGRSAGGRLRKGLTATIVAEAPVIRAVTLRKLGGAASSLVVLAAYLDPEQTDQALDKLGEIACCVHVVWMPAHLQSLARTRELELIALNGR